MKTCIRVFIMMLFAGITTELAAQQSPEALKRGTLYPGFVIKLNGDTIYGSILNTNLWINQHVAYFYKDAGDAAGRVKYKPTDIKAYMVGGRFYESISYPFAYSFYKQNFIQRKAHGPIDYYVWYYDQDRSKLTAPDVTAAELSAAFLFDEDELWTNEFGKKNGGEFTEFSGVKFLMKFAKNMSEYIADYEELAQKVRSKTKGYQGTPTDMERIVTEYNRWKSAVAE